MLSSIRLNNDERYTLNELTSITDGRTNGQSTLLRRLVSLRANYELRSFENQQKKAE